MSLVAALGLEAVHRRRAVWPVRGCTGGWVARLGGCVQAGTGVDTWVVHWPGTLARPAWYTSLALHLACPITKPVPVPSLS